jgi:flavin-dependent dehydrogenase
MSSHFPNSVDVLIVGGGPAGLATAIAARRQGLTVAVADGAVPPIDKPCGEGLMPDGVEALAHIGVEIGEGQGQPFRGIRFVNGDQHAQAVFPNGVAYGIRRTVFHQILLDQAEASGVNLLWQAPVSGLQKDGAVLAGQLIRARWVVGADGAGSRVRAWAGLGAHQRKSIRFAARRHYRIPAWSDFMELYWGSLGQVYVTPVGPQEICVAMISNHGQLDLDDALAGFPQLAARLKDAPYASSERGAITVSRKLRRVWKGNVALVGDASAGVDAITGEGLCLAFRQSALLAECLASNDLVLYQVEHRKLVRRPALMARLMLFMGHQDRIRRRTMRVFESSPRSFAAMLSMHVGAGTARDYFSNGISLGWQLLKA